MGVGVPVPIFDAQGQPAQLIPVSDGNFSDLAAQLKPGQQLRGRVTDVLPDGKAVVNFRGIFVTAFLKGVELAQGEIISVIVKNLGSEPTFQLARSVSVPVVPARSARLDAVTDALLRELGLPRDEFHGTLVRLMADYGIDPGREDVSAVKDFIARLPAQLDRPTPEVSQRAASQQIVARGVAADPVPSLGDSGMAAEAQRVAQPPSGMPAVHHDADILPAQTVASTIAGKPAAIPAYPAIQEQAVLDGRATAISARVIETAVFLYSSGLPPHHEVARAAFEFLFAEPRISNSLVSFERAADALRSIRLPKDISDALNQALNVVRRMHVNPERGQVPEQLRAFVENLGLSHEARLARAATTDSPPVLSARPEGESDRSAPVARKPPGLEGVRESLKAVLLDLQTRIARADQTGLAAPIRESLGALERAAGDLLQVIQAQQMGAHVSQDATNFICVQIPLALGAELRGGEVQVSWKRDREGKRRDARTPAQMSMRLDTRSLGPVNVRMRLLGSSLAIVIDVREAAVRNFVAGELPELIQRLTADKFLVERCVCELFEPQEEQVARPVAPTSSLDLRA